MEKLIGKLVIDNKEDCQGDIGVIVCLAEEHKNYLWDTQIDLWIHWFNGHWRGQLTHLNLTEYVYPSRTKLRYTVLE